MRWCQFAHIREGCNIGKTQSCNLWQQDFAQRGRNMSRIVFAYCHFRHRVLRGRGGGPETGREIEQRSKKSGGKYWPKIALPSFFLSLSLSLSLSLCVCALDRSLLMLSFSDGTDGRTDGRSDGRTEKTLVLAFMTHVNILFHRLIVSETHTYRKERQTRQICSR